MKIPYKNLFILLTTLTLFPASVFSIDYFESGKKAFYMGNYSAANTYFKKALTVDPKNTRYHYFYAQTFIHLKNINEALNEYMKIIELSPYSDTAKLSYIGINKIQEYKITQKKLIYTQIDNNSQKSLNNLPVGDSYIENALDNGLVLRWSLSGNPLKVYFEEPTNLSSYKKEYYTAAKNAFNSWINESGISLKYETANNKKDANIIITFVDSIGQAEKHEGKTGFIGGLTTNHKKNNILQYIDVQLSTKKPNDEVFKYEEIYNTALHEFGHAFGIMGHSSNKNDIMYAISTDESKNTILKLSPRDKNTLNILYKLDADISNFTEKELIARKSKKDNGTNSAILGDNKQRLQNKLKEAQNYVNQVPYHAISWTSLGDAYKNLNKDNEAIDSYKKALTIDPNYLQARTSLAELYNQQGSITASILEYQKLIDSDPKNINYSYNLAQIYYKNKQLMEAKKVIYNLKANNPGVVKNEQIEKLIQQLGIE